MSSSAERYADVSVEEPSGGLHRQEVLSRASVPPRVYDAGQRGRSRFLKDVTANIFTKLSTRPICAADVG